MSIRNMISSGIAGAKSFFEKPLSRAFGTLSEIAATAGSEEDNEEHISESVVRLVLAVARAADLASSLPPPVIQTIRGGTT